MLFIATVKFVIKIYSQRIMIYIPAILPPFHTDKVSIFHSSATIKFTYV